MDFSNLSLQETGPPHHDATPRAPAIRSPKMPDYYLCALCRKLMDGKIYKCPNNHSRLCCKCCEGEGFKPCPDCDLVVLAAVDSPRNWALEMEIALVKMDARNISNQQSETPPNDSTSQSPADRLAGLPRHMLCALCRQLLDGHIYFCVNKHSQLCSACCQENKACPDCDNLIIPVINTPRNYSMEDQISQMKDNNPALVACSGLRKLACPYEAAGCKLRLTQLELEEHRVDCLYRMVQCPIITLQTCCDWRGTNNKLADHIGSEHLESRGGREETTLHNLDRNISQLLLIPLGRFNFLMHVQVDISAQRVCWAVALIGTGHAARTWTYDIQLYSKNEPLRKAKLTNFCVSDAIPKQQMLSRCAQVSLSYALSYLDPTKKLTFKVYIKRKKSQAH